MNYDEYENYEADEAYEKRPSYEERVKELAKGTAQGLGVALLISLAFFFFFVWHGKVKEITFTISDFETIIFATLFLGATFSIIICARNGSQRFLFGSFNHFLSGLCRTFFGGIATLDGGMNEIDAFFIVIGIFKMALGFVVMIPVIFYMIVSYLLNIIYLPIMFLLEKKTNLKTKTLLCQILDALVFVIALGIVGFFCFLILQAEILS